MGYIFVADSIWVALQVFVQFCPKAGDANPLVAEPETHFNAEWPFAERRTVKMNVQLQSYLFLPARTEQNIRQVRMINYEVILLNIFIFSLLSFLPCDALRCTVFVIVILSVRSRGSAATHFRSNTIFSACSSSANSTVKELLKLVHICESYEA